MVKKFKVYELGICRMPNKSEVVNKTETQVGCCSMTSVYTGIVSGNIYNAIELLCFDGGEYIIYNTTASTEDSIIDIVPLELVLDSDDVKISYTIDELISINERINDGYNCNKSLKLAKKSVR